MTRDDFINDVCGWEDLMQFCRDEDLGDCEDIVDFDGLNDTVNEELPDFVSNHSWRDVLDMLQNIYTGYEYYRQDGFISFTGLNSGDFDNYKENIANYMDENDLWDELEPDLEPDIEEDDSSEDGGSSLEDLFRGVFSLNATNT
jgi:hypothetical protein